MQAICKKKTVTYDENGVLEKYHYIGANDKCVIDPEITDNLLIRVSYPIRGGSRTAYVKSLEDFILG